MARMITQFDIAHNNEKAEARSQTMRQPPIVLTLLGTGGVHGFQQYASLPRQKFSGPASYADCVHRRRTTRPETPNTKDSQLFSAQSNSDNEDYFESLRPETSFGSEAVPEAQRPVNEYLDVTSQPLFGWASQEKGDKGLLTRLVVFYSIVFGFICYPISGATFTMDGYLWQKLAASNVGATGLLLVLMIRLYSGWGYIGDRLKSKVIEYEETGWYDGDWERKTDAELRRDRMLYTSDVKPVVDRLKKFTAGTVVLTVLSCASFNVALSNKPLFNQYDPELLERLRYDDKLADTAAQNSGGKPSYCDSRYYRAVANGGQGC